MLTLTLIELNRLQLTLAKHFVRTVIDMSDVHLVLNQHACRKPWAPSIYNNRNRFQVYLHVKRKTFVLFQCCASNSKSGSCKNAVRAVFILSAVRVPKKINHKMASCYGLTMFAATNPAGLKSAHLLFLRWDNIWTRRKLTRRTQGAFSSRPGLHFIDKTSGLQDSTLQGNRVTAERRWKMSVTACK